MQEGLFARRLIGLQVFPVGTEAFLEGGRWRLQFLHRVVLLSNAGRLLAQVQLHQHHVVLQLCQGLILRKARQDIFRLKKYIKISNHRKRSPFLVGTDLKDPLVLCCGQGQLLLDQLAPKAPFNLALNSSRDGAATTSLGNVFSFLQHPHSKEFFPNI